MLKGKCQKENVNKKMLIVRERQFQKKAEDIVVIFSSEGKILALLLL